MSLSSAGLGLASGTPSSAQTRNVSAFEVGSTSRASTSRLNVSSPVTSKPSAAYASCSASQSIRERIPITVGAVVAAGADMSCVAIELALPAQIGNAITGDGDQHGQLRVVVRGAEVLDDRAHAPRLRRDLHRRRT